jgi:hypothetical protein
MEVVTLFSDLWQQVFPATPQISDVAKLTMVGWKYAAKVVDEVTTTGNLIDPNIQKSYKKLNRGDFCRKKKRCFCSHFGSKMRLTLYLTMCRTLRRVMVHISL